MADDDMMAKIIDKRAKLVEHIEKMQLRLSVYDELLAESGEDLNSGGNPAASTEKKIGPTEHVLKLLGEHPDGMTLTEIIDAPATRVESESKDPKANIRSTVTYMLRAERLQKNTTTDKITIKPKTVKPPSEA
jgi:hypothetical protein